MAAGTVEDDPKLDGHLERPAVPGVAEELEPRDPARSVDEGHPARGGGPHERRAQSGALDDHLVVRARGGRRQRRRQEGGGGSDEARRAASLASPERSHATPLFPSF